MIPPEIAKLIRELTPCQLRVLVYISRGLPSKRIAQKTFTSPRTVEKHREKLRSKLGFTGEDDNALLLYAVSLREPLSHLFPDDD